MSKEGRKEGRKREKDVVDAELSLPFPSFLTHFSILTVGADGFTNGSLHEKEERVDCG